MFAYVPFIWPQSFLSGVRHCQPIITCCCVVGCNTKNVYVQIVFGPRRCEGIGLSDAETMERLWSYLRRFSRMTKEMRPSHCIDVLTSALVYYGTQRKEKLGMHFSKFQHLHIMHYSVYFYIRLQAPYSLHDGKEARKRRQS